MTINNHYFKQTVFILLFKTPPKGIKKKITV